jgi:hypothetical protein
VNFKSFAPLPSNLVIGSEGKLTMLAQVSGGHDKCEKLYTDEDEVTHAQGTNPCRLFKMHRGVQMFVHHERDFWYHHS